MLLAFNLAITINKTKCWTLQPAGSARHNSAQLQQKHHGLMFFGHFTMLQYTILATFDGSGLGMGAWEVGLGSGLGKWAWEVGLGMGLGKWAWEWGLGSGLGKDPVKALVKAKGSSLIWVLGMGPFARLSCVTEEGGPN
jgi:hypothetical protein